MGTSFSDLGVDRTLVRALEQLGFTEPFEVQRESIPDAMLGHDICCRAPTGSGKTLAFGLPLLSRTPRAEPECPTSLILTPTRELAEQITQVLTPLAKALNLEVLSIYGGTSYHHQRRSLTRGVDVIVACPGRLTDLLETDSLTLEDVHTVVVDEADRMADMGFLEPVSKLLDACSPKRQTILFSATLDDEVADLVTNYQQNPKTIEVGPKEISMDAIKHFFWLMRNDMKPFITAEAVRKCGRVIIFCRTRRGVERVGEELHEEGVSVTILHGGMEQRKRDRAMRFFTEGKCSAMVATDVAARGIDVKGINCVVHYDPPENGKTYKHRSGRTARAGKTGSVISLIQNPQKKDISRIQRDVGINVKFTPPDFNQLPEYDVEYIPAPRNKNSGRQQRDGGRQQHGRRDSRGGGGGRDRGGDRRDRGRGDSRGGQSRGYQGGRNSDRDGGRQPRGRQECRGDSRDGRGGNRGGHRSGDDGGRRGGDRSGSRDGDRRRDNRSDDGRKGERKPHYGRSNKSQYNKPSNRPSGSKKPRNDKKNKYPKGFVSEGNSPKGGSKGKGKPQYQDKRDAKFKNRSPSGGKPKSRRGRDNHD